MKERPILFSGPMVRAILAGTKTQTRQLITSITHRGPVTEFGKSDTPGYGWHFRDKQMRWHDLREEDIKARCPHGAVGDRLWVRETWGDADHYYQGHANDCPSVVAYRADRSAIQFDAEPIRAIPDSDRANWNWDMMKWKPSIFMPRWASRITLEITGIRAERLQVITEDDARVEGLAKLSKDGGVTWKYGVPDRDGLPGTDDVGQPWSLWDQSARLAFSRLWDSINGDRATWSSNPWVWVIEFRRVAQ